MDHGESIKEAIARELSEEVNLSGDFTYRVIAVEEPSFLKYSRLWQIRLVFQVTPVNAAVQRSEHCNEISFIDPEELKDSDNHVERKVYEYSLLASH